MKWLHEPPQWREENGVLTVRAAGQTDFWRKTHDGGVRDNGHFYFRVVQGDFQVSVKVRGQYRDQFDQAGLMIRADETTWIKCGIEWKDGDPLISVVVTRDWSDWSVARLGKSETIYLRAERFGDTFEISYSLDGQEYELARQTHWIDAQSFEVGPMIAAPTGNGFEAMFEQFAIQEAQTSTGSPFQRSSRP
jgi:regulation of enolase protein 1 (concanavalin A-like superfamily)